MKHTMATIMVLLLMGSAYAQTLASDKIPVQEEQTQRTVDVQRRPVLILKAQGEVFGVRWGAKSDSIAAYSAFGSFVTVWNLDGNVVREIRRKGDHYVGRALAFAENDTALVMRPLGAEANDSAASIVSLLDGNTRNIPGPSPGLPRRLNWAKAITSSPDEYMLAVTFDGGVPQPISIYSTDGWVKLFDIVPQDLGDGIGDRAGPVSFSASGRLLAIGMHFDVLVYDLIERRVSKRLRVFSPERGECCISAVVFSPNASSLAVATSSFSIGHCEVSCSGEQDCCEASQLQASMRLIALDGGQESYLSHLPKGPVWDLDWNSKVSVIASIISNTVYISGLYGAPSLKLGESATSLAFSPNGKLLAVSNGDSIKVYVVNYEH